MNQSTTLLVIAPYRSVNKARPVEQRIVNLFSWPSSSRQVEKAYLTLDRRGSRLKDDSDFISLRRSIA
jgi:hypothetical protein